MIARFFAVAGLLCVALVYHLGSSASHAQGSQVEMAHIESNGNSTAVVGRLVYFWHGSRAPVSLVTPNPIPGSSRVVACTAGFEQAWAILENGELWAVSDSDSWALLATFPGSSTSAHRASWGSLKATHR
jgi:hypothetical protein